MISGIFHQGSGLGNQLHRYVYTRVKALDLGVDFGMENPELFKGSSFLHLDMGKPVQGVTRIYREKKLTNSEGVNITPYDQESEHILDNTEVDGEFQDPKYFMHRLHEIRRWFNVPLIDLPENVCIINFRGGEYVGVKDLFLTQEYWDVAVTYMRTLNPHMVFIVVTDDVVTAQKFFPDFMVRHHLPEDYTSIQSAHYLILSNSSFAILPSLLNQRAKLILAPKYWAGRNKGYWQLPQNQYEQFTYL